MNIKEAKEEIKNTVRVYLAKDRFGYYRIPVQKQRPIFLMGPAGIGKTDIMEQIAEELDIGLVSYSMTHHTRQSALGLPFIEKKVFGGKEYNVSEYTMSEIIAAVYKVIEESGKKEGILFLDEINCVSETLAPSMLQFLQYKVFGTHRVPDGWVIVTAGNPPEYNKSVREFDIVTWDRLKRIDVEADFGVWKEYAYKAGIHASVITYLDIKKNDFYKVETTAGGKSFVTARGWSDLSEIIKLYEENNIPVRESLIVQYLQNKTVAKNFAVYYDLFNKYKSDYQVDKILEGKADASLVERAKNAKFDERLALTGLLVDGCTGVATDIMVADAVNSLHLEYLTKIRMAIAGSSASAADEIDKQIGAIRAEADARKKAGNLTANDNYKYNALIEALTEDQKTIIMGKPADNTAAYKLLADSYKNMIVAHKKKAAKTSEMLSNAFKFCNQAFSDGQEVLILVTEFTINYYVSQFISSFGCKEYFKYNKDMLFINREKAIDDDIKNFERIMPDDSDADGEESDSPDNK